MSDDNDGADLEFSPLSGPFTQEGTTVNVMIYRPEGSAAGWTLEVVVDDDASVLFDHLFPSDVEAYDEFNAMVQENGLADVIDLPDEET